MSYALKLFYHKKLYDTEKTNELFVKAIHENIRYHQEHCSEYAAILTQKGFALNEIQSIHDLYKIPPIPTPFLKHHTLYSTNKRLLFASTTSGTSGRVSKVGLDWPSVWRGLGMILGTFSTHKLVSPRFTNYIMLGYQPAKRNKMAVVKSTYATTYAAPALHREYALKDTGEAYELNLDGIKNALLRYEKSGHPVRFMGFPAYFMFLIRELHASGIKLRLHPKSRVILGGGWKQFLTEQVDKQELYEMSKETLGIGSDRIGEFFSAVEHPVIYFSCPNHHFHVPVYARVMIRDSELKPVDYGVPGLLNLITPMMTSMPFTSVMTDDLAVLYPGEACGCGIESPYFEVLGRIGLAGIKTCAAGASELR